MLGRGRDVQASGHGRGHPSTKKATRSSCRWTTMGAWIETDRYVKKDELHAPAAEGGLEGRARQGGRQQLRPGRFCSSRATRRPTTDASRPSWISSWINRLRRGQPSPGRHRDWSSTPPPRIRTEARAARGRKRNPMGMSAGGSSGGGAKSDINVTPLVDVCLVLLIIFMVMVPRNVPEISVRIPPESKTRRPPPPGAEKPLVIGLSAKTGRSRSTPSRWKRTKLAERFAKTSSWKSPRRRPSSSTSR